MPETHHCKKIMIHTTRPARDIDRRTADRSKCNLTLWHHLHELLSRKDDSGFPGDAAAAFFPIPEMRAVRKGVGGRAGFENCVRMV